MAPVLLMWGRYDEPVREVDRVVPRSRGGPTVASNGQALCKARSRSKGAMDWRVLEAMNEEERAAHPRLAANRRTQRGA